MAHVDSLSYFDELIKSGSSDAQARAHIRALEGGIKDLVTKDDLHKEISGLEVRIDSKFVILENNISAKVQTFKTLGWALFVAIVIPGVKFTFF